MDEPGAGLRLFCSTQFGHLVARRVRQQFNVIMLASTLAFFLESADAFSEFIEASLSAQLAEAFGDVLELRLEAFAKTLMMPCPFCSCCSE
jgi:hypothetical protein